MRKPDQLIRKGRALAGLLMLAAHLAPRWLPPAAVLALTLGIGASFQSVVVQAQDDGSQTGQEATVTYELVIDDSGTNLDRVCVGRTVRLPVNIIQNVEVSGNANPGRVQVRGLNIEVTSQNADILTANLEASANNPLQPTLVLTAHSPGRTSVTADVTVQTARGVTSLHQSMSVRVVPCVVKVQMSTVWTTTMQSSSVVLIASIPGAVLTLPESEIALAPEVPASVDWFATANRIRGCQGVSNKLTHDRASTIVQLEEDAIRVDIEFNQNNATTLFSCHRPFVTGINCDPLPDGTCYPELSPNDFWRVERLVVDLPLDGGTKTVELPLTHAGGRATGAATITVTVMPSQ
jgi:hypothetical protein